MARQGSIAEPMLTSEFLDTPGRQLQGLISANQLHLRHHQRGIVTLKHIKHPIASGKIKAIAALDQPSRAELEQSFGIDKGNRVLKLQTRQGWSGAAFWRSSLDGEVSCGDGLAPSQRLVAFGQRLADANAQGESIGSADQIALPQPLLPTAMATPLVAGHQKTPLNLQCQAATASDRRVETNAIVEQPSNPKEGQASQLGDDSSLLKLPAQCNLWVRVR